MTKKESSTNFSTKRINKSFVLIDLKHASDKVISRSIKKTKIHGITTAVSEKENKQEANRKFRRIIKKKVKLEKTELPDLREVSNVWRFAKDGKKYDPKMTEKELRK